ncbi:hypothetical protein ACE1ET_20260 [Saccharicrinis sp. FJH62]|uniref:hypothetical protein n=1 Tax=Saccharicrinis sp. FJH62 TaxID=3344657 RepID=UPI0035D4056C
MNKREVNLLIGLFIIYLLIGCNRNNSQKDEYQIQNLIANGELKNFSSLNDTLTLVFNLSGCIDRRFDFIKIFRVKNKTLINAEIVDNFHEQPRFFESKIYDLSVNDSLSFENLIQQIQKYEIQVRDTNNSQESKSIFLSLGALNKWGKYYSIEKLTEERSEFYKMYLSVMHRIYPDIEDFRPMENLIFMDAEIEEDSIKILMEDYIFIEKDSMND